MLAKASKERKKEKKIALPVYAQGILTLEDLVQDSFEGKIGYAQLYGFGHQECIQFHQFQFGHRQLTLFGYRQFLPFKSNLAPQI